MQTSTRPHSTQRTGRSWRRLSAIALVCLWLPGVAASGADKAAITASMNRGAAYLQANFDKITDPGERGLAALALFKSGIAPNQAPVSTVVNEVVGKVSNGKYNPQAHHRYEAGVDATLLADIDAAKYRPQIQAITQYLIEAQLPNGGWDYPSGREGRGDTSVVQYACLGLWASERAGIEVPPDVWVKALQWHTRTQRTDGGYTYVPGTTEGLWGGESSLNMTSAALGSMMIAARHVFPGQADDLQQLAKLPKQEPKQAAADSPLGPLQKIDLTEAAVKVDPKDQPLSADIGETRQAVNRAFGWLQPRFVPMRTDSGHYRMYYMYAVERMASLANVEQIGSFSWYDDGSAALLKIQEKDGSWYPMKQYGKPWRDTSFALLYLSRSTGKILKRTEAVPTVGGGLLTGGKGEPGIVTEAKREPTPLDKLLASLQNPGSLDLEAAQEDLIEQVQIGDKAELVGQKDLLVKLMRHPHGEVRRTAVWALGRTNDLKLARHLVERLLDDSDAGVLMEAHAALSWLSRRFDGFGLPVNPLDEVAEDAAEEQKRAAIENWRSRAIRSWGDWYLRVRPYSERGDEFEARLRQALGQPIR